MLERKVTLERMGMKVGVDTMDARMKDFDRELDLIHGRLEQAQAMLEQSPARRTALVAEAAAPPAEHAFARPPRASRTRSMSLSRDGMQLVYQPEAVTGDLHQDPSGSLMVTRRSIVAVQDFTVASATSA